MLQGGGVKAPLMHLTARGNHPFVLGSFPDFLPPLPNRGANRNSLQYLQGEGKLKIIWLAYSSQSSVKKSLSLGHSVYCLLCVYVNVSEVRKVLGKSFYSAVYPRQDYSMVPRVGVLYRNKYMYMNIIHILYSLID